MIEGNDLGEQHVGTRGYSWLKEKGARPVSGPRALQLKEVLLLLLLFGRLLLLLGSFLFLLSHFQPPYCCPGQLRYSIETFTTAQLLLLN